MVVPGYSRCLRSSPPPEPLPMKFTASSRRFFEMEIVHLLGSAWVITCVHSQALRHNGNTRLSANGENVEHTGQRATSLRFQLQSHRLTSASGAAFVSKAELTVSRQREPAVAAAFRENRCGRVQRMHVSMRRMRTSSLVMRERDVQTLHFTVQRLIVNQQG